MDAMGHIDRARYWEQDEDANKQKQKRERRKAEKQLRKK